MTSFHIETHGSPVFTANAEQMTGLLTQAKFNLTDLETADLVVLNFEQQDPLPRIEEIKRQFPYKIFILSGCIADSNLKKYPFVGTRQVHHIVEVVEEALHHNPIQLMGTAEMTPLLLPKIRQNQYHEIIPLHRGCLHSCLCCNTKENRTALQSYPIADILSTVKQAISEGVKVIELASPDAGRYGIDVGTNISCLVEELLKLPGHFKLLLGSTSPEYLKNQYSTFLPLLNHENVFKFVHLPMVCGSNHLLKLMRLNYTAEEYLLMVQQMKMTIPHVTLVTDIIVGHPLEGEEDYVKTMELLRKISPDEVRLSRYHESKKQLDEKITAHRAKVLLDIAQNISTLENERWKGWEGELIITEKLTEKGSGTQWIGRNFAYKPVIVEGDYRLGDNVQVKITKTTIFELRGEMVKNG